MSLTAQPSGLPWHDPKMLEKLFDLVPCYISVLDRDYRIVRVNDLFRRDFGDRVGELCHQVYHRRAEQCPDCPVRVTFRDGTIHESEVTLTTRDGRQAHVVAHTSPVRDPDGRIVAVMEVMTNISEVKRLQYDLEESRERFRLLFDEVPCYIAVIGPDFRIQQANRRFRDDFGEPDQHYCYEQFKHRTEKCEECPVAAAFADGQVHQSEELLTGRSGRPVQVVVYAAPIRDLAGRVVAVMEMAADITPVRELQSQLAELGQLVAGLAHSIKGILMGLDGGVYVVESGFDHADQQEVEQGWRMVRRNVDRISKLAFDMLYCARDREPQLSAVSPSVLAGEVCDLFEDRTKRNGIELVRRLDPRAGPIQADAKGLHTLLVNLVTNAIDACRLDTRDDVEHRVEVHARPEADGVALAVVDNGPGMPEEVRSKLFNLFYSTKRAEGTGLGLLVSRKVVQEHGGSIEVDSAPNQGSTFTAHLPSRPKAH